MVAANWPFEKRWPFVAQAVRVGNYYAEDQEEVLRYIAEVHRHQTDSTCWILDFFQAFSEKVWWFSQLETSILFKVQGFASHVWFPKGKPINLPLNPIKRYKTL